MNFPIDDVHRGTIQRIASTVKVNSIVEPYCDFIDDEYIFTVDDVQGCGLVTYFYKVCKGLKQLNPNESIRGIVDREISNEFYRQMNEFVYTYGNSKSIFVNHEYVLKLKGIVIRLLEEKADEYDLPD